GDFQKKDSARWFSSRTQWCTSPYLPPPRLEKTIAASDEGSSRGGGFLGMGRKRPQGTTRTVFVTPRLFQDLSAVRMGQEADDVTQVMQTDGTVLTGVSSPKRYLWADDDSWLQGAIWHMADPEDRLETHNYAGTLQGPLLRYLEEEDPDELELPSLESDEISDEELSREVPYKPHHAPRCMMVAALYEMVAQAYTYVNSEAYRSMTGDQGRPREIRNLTLTYPSGMITQERERFRLQAQKALDLFRKTLGRMQRNDPTLTLSIDEASAVHLTYLWSELQLVDRDPRLWFSLIGHKPLETEREETEDTPVDEEDVTSTGMGPRIRPGPGGPPGGPSGMGPGRPPGMMRPPSTLKPGGPMGPGRPGGPPRPTPAPAPVVTSSDAEEDREVRIACIDIGGGTSDLMIARYELTAGTVDNISGEMLHRDGISHAGDQLVKRLLERIIVPYFSDRVGM
ncbi:MAG: virulence factor SrfB, partial [Planctomycetaceae bacterium]|nr:virulence factor SrfB [Planctomycetaceae bacterium]